MLWAAAALQDPRIATGATVAAPRAPSGPDCCAVTKPKRPARLCCYNACCNPAGREGRKSRAVEQRAALAAAGVAGAPPF